MLYHKHFSEYFGVVQYNMYKSITDDKGCKFEHSWIKVILFFQFPFWCIMIHSNYTIKLCTIKQQ